MESELLQNLVNKTMTKQQLFEKVKQNHGLIPNVLDGISSSKPAIRYGCAKVLMDMSEDEPGELYPYMDVFIKMLESKYRILVWNAIITIANLTTVDTEKKFDAVFDKFFDFLNDEYMVTVANIVGNSGMIALAKPYLTQRITDKLLSVEQLSTTPHLTEECKRVIAGHAIKTFDTYFQQIEEKEKVISFVKKYINSSRESLRNESVLFLKKWG